MIPSWRSVMSASQAILWLLGSLLPISLSVVVVGASVIDRRLASWKADVFPWTAPPTDPTAVYLAGYVFLLGVGLAIAVAATAVRRHRAWVDARFPAVPAWPARGGAVAAGAISVEATTLGEAAAQAIMVFSLCLVAALFLRVALARAPNRFIRAAWGVPALVIGVSPLVLALAVTPFHVPNEFLTLPSKTILADGRVVDTIGYFNSHGLEGMHIADPRSPDPDADRIVVTLKPGSAEASDEVSTYATNNLARLWFDPSSGRLEIHGEVTTKDYLFLERLVRRADLPTLRRALVHDEVKNKELATRHLTSEERDFFRRNSVELDRALRLGRYYYHHAYLFGPALRGVLEGSVKRASQYGRGFTEALALALSLVPEGRRFNAYLAMIYASYALYAVMIWWLARVLGLTPWQRIFALTVLLFGYLVPNIADTRLGVGLLPWRHPLDIVALVLLHRLVVRASTIYGSLLALTIAVATYWSRESGLFLGAAVIGYMALHSLLDRHKGQLTGSIAVAVVALAVGWVAGNPHAQTAPLAMLEGVNTPDLFDNAVLMLSILVFGLAFGWWRLRPGRDIPRRQHGDWALAGATLAYCTAANIYFLWYPSPHHISLLVGVLALALPITYRLYNERREQGNGAWVRVAVVGLLALVTLMGMNRWRGIRQEMAVFATHPVHEWVMPEGRLASTAQPALLLQTIDQIRRYDPDPGVNILSPWAVFVAPFAGKYPTGPFVLNFDALVYPSDVRLLIDYLVNVASPVLFVDSRLMRGEYEGLMSPNASLHYLVSGEKSRIGAHVMLRRVFAALRPCYDEIDKGPLLDVYRRKPGATVHEGACRAPGS